MELYSSDVIMLQHHPYIYSSLFMDFFNPLRSLIIVNRIWHGFNKTKSATTT